MGREVIRTSGAPQAIGPYSHGVKAGGWLFLSGQIPLHPGTGKLVGDSMEEQTERVLENVKTLLAAAGMSLEDVVQCTVYMTDLSEFGSMNQVYARYFPQDPPARVTVGVASLPKGAKIEISLVAFHS